MAIIYILTALVIGFVLTYGTVPPIVTLSNEKKLFDVPNKRKLNKVVVPTLGGIPIFIGWVLSSLLCLQGYFIAGMQYLLVAILFMFFIGLKDDITLMSANKKFALQLLVATMLVTFGDFRVIETYGLFGFNTINIWISIPVSVILILFLTNAINLIDGIDGLASGLSLLAALFLGIWFFLSDSMAYAIVCFALAGSLIAFMRFNLSNGKNKMFMGDTGSLVLGIFWSVMTIYFNNNNIHTLEEYQFLYPPVILLALFIVPITDTLRVFFIRIKNKRSPFSPDMNHFHHLLIKGGFTHIQSTCMLISYTITFILLAITFSYFEIGITISFILLLTLSFGSVGVIFKAIKTQENKKTQMQLKRLQTKTVDFNLFPKPNNQRVKIPQVEKIN